VQLDRRDPRPSGALTWGALAVALVVLAAGCGGVEDRPAPAADAVREDSRLAFARTVATKGVPSPTPQLDALADALAGATPGRGLEDLLTPSPERLRPGDQLDVRCAAIPELSGARAVGEDGQVEGPLGLIEAVGLTTDELARRLEAQVASTYTKASGHEVEVRVIQRAARSVEVLGRVGAHTVAVAQAGATPPMATSIALPPDRPLGVYELLTLTQGLAPDADADRLLLIRHQPAAPAAPKAPAPPKAPAGAPPAGQPAPPPGGGAAPADISPVTSSATVVYHFTYAALVEAHLAGREAWLQADDQLVVPRLPDVYVYGEVAAPGRYTWRPGLTAAALLLVAGGTTAEGDAAQALVLAGADARPAGAEDALRAGEVLFVPQVQKAYVVGLGVKNNGPLVLPASGLSAIQAISEAGWFTPYGAPNDVQILRTERGRRVTIDVPVQDVLDGERSEAEFMLRPGDTVVVPEGLW
jgi:protein involved in polysaccharide export with SLBB domain